MQTKCKKAAALLCPYSDILRAMRAQWLCRIFPQKAQVIDALVSNGDEASDVTRVIIDDLLAKLENIHWGGISFVQGGRGSHLNESKAREIVFRRCGDDKAHVACWARIRMFAYRREGGTFCRVG